MSLGIQKNSNNTRVKAKKTVVNLQVPGGDIVLPKGSFLTWMVLESALENNVVITTENGTVEFFNDTVQAGIPYEASKGWMVPADTTLSIVCTENLTVTLYTF